MALDATGMPAGSKTRLAVADSGTCALVVGELTCRRPSREYRGDIEVLQDVYSTEYMRILATEGAA
jgi:hypothetical protein